MGVATVAKRQKLEKIYTLEEYLEREAKALNKHEFHKGKIIKMAGGTDRHSEITGNMIYALKLSVKPLPRKFRVYDSNLKIYIETVDRCFYPDALVICEEPEYLARRRDVIVNPLMIVEVLSRGTVDFDRKEKFMYYQTLPSFREYVLVEQNQPQVESWFRPSPNNWVKTLETDLTKTIHLPSLNVSLALADIYDNVLF